MELHEWWYRRVRDELAARVKITADELALLRHEQQGHSSKVIASAMNTQPATIDCRFQRLTSRLGMANRRSALALRGTVRAHSATVVGRGVCSDLRCQCEGVASAAASSGMAAGARPRNGTSESISSVHSIGLAAYSALNLS